MPKTRRRPFAVLAAVVAAVTATVALPGVAAAAPPANDDVTAATAVTALPYATQTDTSEATRAGDDPYWCQTSDVAGTVWFRYTATEDGLLRATATGADHGTILSANTGVPGNLTGVPDACDVATVTGSEITFRARAGTTYHLMVAGYDAPGNDLAFTLDRAAPAPNDAFADAEEITALPATAVGDLSTAGTEYDEPEPGSPCYGTENRSVWYRHTPAAATPLSARVDDYDSAVEVYTGGTLPDLRLVGCADGGFSDRVLFAATAGETYWFRVTASRAAEVALTVEVPPALNPRLGISPEDPTIHELTQFSVESGEWETPVVGGELDFGDGTVEPLHGESPSHHYTQDGTYQATATVRTADGRTGTRTMTVEVVTHDVSVAKFVVPVKGRAGETKTITVHVANAPRYREQGVTATLLRSDGSTWQEVGSLTLDVPKDRTVKFPFAYTFTSADAVTGKVAFRTVVRLRDDVRDARPMDNELISAAATVTPSAADLRFA
jgi:hypothetical protein